MLPTIKNLLYPGCTARIIGHTEVWIRKGVRPADVTRWPGYDQQNPTDVAAHCVRLRKMGLDILMFNTYAIGSWENKSLELYLPATIKAGLNVIINIDKNIYHNKPSPITEIRNYLTYLRKVAFPLPNYEKWQGKFIVTYFALPGDDPNMFATIEKENPDCVFVYNEPTFGHSQMSWVHKGLETSLDSWCATYAKRTDGLFIPNVSPGFDDTYQGHSVWNSNVPARVYPAGIGPNPTTLTKHFAVLNKYYSVNNQLQYLQLVTVNDWDELTAMEAKVDGTGGYFTPLPDVVLVRGELWLDGKKLGDVSLGDHQLTLVKVYSDGNLVKTTSTVSVK